MGLPDTSRSDPSTDTARVLQHRQAQDPCNARSGDLSDFKDTLMLLAGTSGNGGAVLKVA